MSGDESDLASAEMTPRETGRAWSFDLQSRAQADGAPDRWFDELYAKADGESGFIPWENAAPRDRLSAWLSDNPGNGKTALDVGCGLGDNASLLAAAGYQVTAFDLSGTAAAWAARRFPDQGIAFQQADIFSLPDAFTGAFDLVHECYNLQAMDPERVPEALACIAATVKPGGRLLVLTRAALEGVPKGERPAGPPTPIARETLERSVPSGLSRDRMDLFHDQRDPPIPHWLGEWTRSTD